MYRTCLNHNKWVITNNLVDGEVGTKNRIGLSNLLWRSYFKENLFMMMLESEEKENQA